MLKSVAQSLAGSGYSRRAIVYVTSGSIAKPTPPTPDGAPHDYDEAMDAFEAARRADVPIYTIDPRGQVLPEDAVRGGIGAIHSESIRATISANIRLQQDRLAVIALNTGGRAFTNQSNLTRAVHEIVAENGSYYLLGYYPDAFAHDGKFHPISVHVKRPGVRVRARPGYVAASSQPASTSAKPVLDAAMSAGVDVSGLSLRAFVAPIEASAKGMKTVVTLEVTYPAPVDESRQIDDDLQMNILALDPDAKVKASSARALHFKGTARDQSAVTFLLDDVVDLPSQSLTLRVGVSSRALGKAGTVQLPVDVPKPSDSKLQMATVAIGFAGPEREAVMGAEALKTLLPFQPTTTRTFATSDTLRLFGRMFWRSKDDAAQVTLTISGRSVPASQSIPTTSSRGPTGARQAQFDATMPLAGLMAGSYELIVEARVPSGQTVKRAIAFEIR